MILDAAAVREIFRQFLPDDVTVVEVDHDDYIREARQHPFIAAQIRQGIYDDETFGDEFLSVARSYSERRLIEIDMHLILSHMEGVHPLLASAYCATIALHEYHHIEHHKEPAGSPREQLMREVECERYLLKEYPYSNHLSEKAEEASKTISKVYARIEQMPGA